MAMVRLRRQPGGGDARPERGAPRPLPRGPLHGGARALPHRHGPLRRRAAARHHLAGARRPLLLLRPVRGPAGPRRPSRRSAQSWSNWELFRRLAAEHGASTSPSSGRPRATWSTRCWPGPRALRGPASTTGALADGRGGRARAAARAGAFRTPSGKVELQNPRQRAPAAPLAAQPRGGRGAALPAHDRAPRCWGLNSSFRERPELREREGEPALMVNSGRRRGARARRGRRVVAWNELGRGAASRCEVTDRTPPGVVVAEGVPWLSHVQGGRNVNALTSQRLTDEGGRQHLLRQPRGPPFRLTASPGWGISGPPNRQGDDA